MNSARAQTPALQVGINVGDQYTGRGIAIAIAFVLTLSTLWALTHRYDGFARDGELYALQALARVQPSLSADLYLKNTSQDQYTIFSPIYAVFIKTLGLQRAELALFSLCAVWFLTAAWNLARKLSTSDEAWLSIVFLIVTVGYYGADHIFSYAENYLTARSLGEALTVTALASHYSGRRILALFIEALALFVHPLMALPGALLLICLWLPSRLALVGAAAGVLATLGFAATAAGVGFSSQIATVMDAEWLEVVRERSQFLFLKYWTWADWEIVARPVVCLTLTAMVTSDPRTRKLSLCTILVGTCGMAVAAIACTVGPIAILLQGQAWRWMWVTTFVSVLLLAPTLRRVWRDERCGPLCATLLGLGWTCPILDGFACVGGALSLWLLRPYISIAASRYLKWAAGAVGAVILIWMLANSWTFAFAPIPETGRESILIGRLREVFGLGVSGLLVGWLILRGTRKLSSPWSISIVCVFFLAAASWIFPGSVKQLETVGTPEERRNFAEWRAAIPPASTVLLIPPRKSASFAWFTLERTSYLTVDQSAGVVFSRATSLEVRRRSEVLLPLMYPDWKILSSIMRERSRRSKSDSRETSISAEPKTLTAEALVGVCGDPGLDFVIAKENVGFDPLRHTYPGSFKDWNLYDCRRVRARVPAA
jgi:hypothetical protein